MKITAIIKKNFKLVLRSKVSALILLFGPLLIIFLVGLAFNTGQSLQVNVGYYSPDYNDLTDSFIDLLKTQQYSLKQYASEAECRDAIAGGLAHICVIFPEGFRIENDRINEVRFLVDNSKINLFESVVDSIETKFNIRAFELSAGMAEDIVARLNQTKSEIASKNVLFDQLKSENKQMYDLVRSMYRNMSSLDLSFSSADFKIAELKRQSGDISSSLSSIRDEGFRAVESGLDLTDDIRDTIKDINLSAADRKELNDLLTSAVTSFNSIKASLEDEGLDADEKSDRLLDLISASESSLNKIEEKIRKAQSARDRVMVSANATQKNLNQSLVKINAVENSFKAIAQNLAGTKVTDVQTIISPIVKKVEPIVTAESQLNYYFPYLIVLVVMFIGILLASTLSIMEKTSNAHFRNLITPTGDLIFMLGHFFTTLIILVVQVIVILLIYTLYFNQELFSALWPTSIVLFLIMGFFTLLGMVVGNIFDSEETGTLASISISSIFLFISDLVYPLEKMPVYVADLARNYNPFVFGTDLLRRTMVHKLPMYTVGLEILALLGICAGAFLVTYLVMKVTKKQYLLRAAGYMSRQQLGRKYKAIEDQRIFEASRNVTAEKAFKTSKGTASTPGELSVLISAMDDMEFREYVNNATGKNDFAVWAKEVLDNDALADRLRKEDTRKGTASILARAQEDLERIGRILREKQKREQKSKRYKAEQQLSEVEKKLVEKNFEEKKPENKEDEAVKQKKSKS